MLSSHTMPFVFEGCVNDNFSTKSNKVLSCLHYLVFTTICTFSDSVYRKKYKLLVCVSIYRNKKTNLLLTCHKMKKILYLCKIVHP